MFIILTSLILKLVFIVRSRRTLFLIWIVSQMEDIFLPFMKGGMNDIDLGETSSSQQESSSQDQTEPLSMDIDSTSTQVTPCYHETDILSVVCRYA